MTDDQLRELTNLLQDSIRIQIAAEQDNMVEAVSANVWHKLTSVIVSNIYTTIGDLVEDAVKRHVRIAVTLQNPEDIEYTTILG